MLTLGSIGRSGDPDRGGRHGSLVLQHVGRYDNGAATSELTIVSGTNELKGAEGSGSFKADPAGSVTLDISFGD